MRALRRFVIRHARKLLLLAVAGAIFALWLGLWVRVLPLKGRVALTGTKSPRLITFSPDGKTLALVTSEQVVQRTDRDAPVAGSVTLWHFASGKQHVLTDSAPLERAEFSSDGRCFLTLPNWRAELTIWDARSGTKRTTITAGLPRLRFDGSEPVGSLASELWGFMFSPDGQVVLTCDQDGKTLLISNLLARNSPVILTDAFLPVTFSPDGKLLATGTWSEKAILLWDVRTGRLVRTIAGQQGKLLALGFSPDSSVLESHESAKDGDGYRQQVRLWEVATGLERESVQLAQQPGDGVSLVENTMMRRQKGRWLSPIVVESVRRSSTCIFPSGGLPLGRSWRETWRDAAMSPEQTQLAIVDQQYGLPATVRVFNVSSLQEQASTLLTWPDYEGSDSVLALRFVKGGRSLIIAGEYETKDPVGSGPIPRWIAAQPPNADGKRCVSLVKSWDPHTGEEEPLLRVPHRWAEAVISSDGRFLATRDWDGAVEIWDLPPRRPIFLLLTLAALPTLLFTALLWWRLVR